MLGKLLYIYYYYILIAITCLSPLHACRHHMLHHMLAAPVITSRICPHFLRAVETLYIRLGVIMPLIVGVSGAVVARPLCSKLNAGGLGFETLLIQVFGCLMYSAFVFVFLDYSSHPYRPPSKLLVGGCYIRSTILISIHACSIFCFCAKPA